MLPFLVFNIIDALVGAPFINTNPFGEILYLVVVSLFITSFKVPVPGTVNLDNNLFLQTSSDINHIIR